MVGGRMVRDLVLGVLLLLLLLAERLLLLELARRQVVAVAWPRLRCAATHAYLPRDGKAHGSPNSEYTNVSALQPQRLS